MADLPTTLRQIREHMRVSQAELARRLGLSPSTISQRESGLVGVPPEEIERFAQLARVEVSCRAGEWSFVPVILLEEVEPGPSIAEIEAVIERRAALKRQWALAQTAELPDAPTVAFRSFGSAPCGAPIYVDVDEPEEVDLGHLTDGVWDVERHYLLRAAGDSMEPWIYDGDWMIVEHERLPRISDIVVANVNGQGCTVKRLAPSRDGGGRVLAPTNPAHRPIELTEYDEVDCQGVVIGCIRAYVSLADGDPVAAQQRARRRRR